MACYHTNPYFSSIKRVALTRFHNYYNQLSSAFPIVLFKSLNVPLLNYIVWTSSYILITILRPLPLHTFTLIHLARCRWSAFSASRSTILGPGKIKVLMHSHQSCSLHFQF